MRTAAKASSRRADQKDNAVSGVLMAAFMGASPFVAYAAGRWADATFSRAAPPMQQAETASRVELAQGLAA